MSLDVDEKRKANNSDRYLLGFRETVTLAIGYFPNSLTKTDLYKLYSRAHSQLKRIHLVEFKLPDQSIFNAMIKKLHSKGIVIETYMHNNYTISLTDSGEAVFDLILANLQSHPDYNRITNVFDFYRNAPINY